LLIERVNALSGKIESLFFMKKHKQNVLDIIKSADIYF